MTVVLVARERVAKERCITRAIDAAQWVKRSGFQTRCSHEDLEYGSWRETALNRAILHRLARIFRQVLPVRCRDARRKKVGVVSRPADERKNFSRSRIERNNGAGAISHG